LCAEHGVGGDSVCCGDNDAQLDRINVFYHEASAESTYHAQFSSISNPA
jgi:hypothetical protein